MRRVLFRAFATMLALLLCVGPFNSAFAASRASSYLTRYVAEAIPDRNGIIQVKFSVSSNQLSTELGASYILLEESNDNGRTWHTAIEYEGESWMTTTNRISYTRAITYQGKIGNQYRVTAEVFARDENGGDARTTPTSSPVTAKR